MAYINGKKILFSASVTTTEGGSISAEVLNQVHQNTTDITSLKSKVTETSENTVDKIAHIDTQAGDENTNVRAEKSGVRWNQEFLIESAESEMARGKVYQNVPIVAGENVSFEVDEEKQVVKINALEGLFANSVEAVHTAESKDVDLNNYFEIITPTKGEDAPRGGLGCCLSDNPPSLNELLKWTLAWQYTDNSSGSAVVTEYTNLVSELERTDVTGGYDFGSLVILVTAYTAFNEAYSTSLTSNGVYLIKYEMDNNDPDTGRPFSNIYEAISISSPNLKQLKEEYIPDTIARVADVEQTVTDKVAEIVADAPEDFDTLKEMSTWIASHEGSAAEMNSAIKQNTDDIKELQNAGYLTKIPEQYVTDTELNEALANIDIPSGDTTAIIDVDSLPTENINGNAFYRVKKDDAYVLINGLKNQYPISESVTVPITVHLVDTLPEVGELWSTGSAINVYFLATEKTGYIYTNEDGWQTAEEANVPFVLISSPDEATETNVGYLVYVEAGLFSTNGEKTIKASTLYNQEANKSPNGYPVVMMPVDALPTSDIKHIYEGSGDNTVYYFYVLKDTKEIYAYMNNWLDFEGIKENVTLAPNLVIVSSEAEATEADTWYFVIKEVAKWDEYVTKAQLDEAVAGAGGRKLYRHAFKIGAENTSYSMNLYMEGYSHSKDKVTNAPSVLPYLNEVSAGNYSTSGNINGALISKSGDEVWYFIYYVLITTSNGIMTVMALRSEGEPIITSFGLNQITGLADTVTEV